MTNIAIPDQTYQRIAALAAIRNLSPDAFIAEEMEQIAQRNTISTKEPSPNEWLRNFETWMAEVEARSSLVPAGHFIDDSRESIYEGCGE